MSEVYDFYVRVRPSFEDMTEMLLNISNDQRRGLREAYVLSKREEYCLIGKSDDEVEEIIRKKSPKDRLSMMKCFKVPYSQRPLRLTSAILKEHRCHFIPKRCDDIGIYMMSCHDIDGNMMSCHDNICDFMP